MIDTNSPEYTAGVRAGRSSIRITIFQPGTTSAVLSSVPVSVLRLHGQVPPGELGAELGPTADRFSMLEVLGVRLMFEDTMPDFEDFPDPGE